MTSVNLVSCHFGSLYQRETEREGERHSETERERTDSSHTHIQKGDRQLSSHFRVVETVTDGSDNSGNGNDNGNGNGG